MLAASRLLVVFWLLALLFGCKKREEPKVDPAEPKSAATGPVVVLSGEFRPGARTTSGHAEIVRDGERWELRLHGVTTKAKPPIHVYLVGLPEARLSRDVHETDTKYDFGELDPGGTQVIQLPSEPAPELRSVVLWSPDYGVNIGWAPLSEQGP